MANKALIVNPYWDTLGGGERYVGTFAKLLLDLGWEVDLLWPEDFSARLFSRFGLQLAKARWLPDKYTPMLSANYRLLFWLSDGSLPVSLAKNTIIHLQFPFTGIKGRSWFNKLKSRRYKFVVNSEFTKQHIDSEFGVVSHVVYPPVDTAAFTPGKKGKVILYVGRFSDLTQAKSQPVLIDAFRLIHPAVPDWKLILAGGVSVGCPPGMLEDLRRRSAGLPVKLVTDPSFDQLRRLYSRARIFWSASGYGIDQRRFPTRVEHFGITVVEAMASGCIPVIVNQGGHPEIIGTGNSGYLWSEPGDLADCTLKIIRGGDLAGLSHQARLRSKIFDINRFNSSFSELID